MHWAIGDQNEVETMSEFKGFDQTVEHAWTYFAASLATHLREMRDGDRLVLTPAGAIADNPAYLDFLGRGDGFLACEVPHNSGHGALLTMTADGEALLADLGWQPPLDAATDPHYTGLPANELDDWAARSVTVLREVWDVPHPGFLAAQTTGRPATLAFISAEETVQQPGYHDPMTAVVPRDDAHLREIVSAVAEDLTGNPPTLDEDGDYVIRIGSRLVFLIPRAQDRILRIWVPLLSRISGRTRTSELIGDLNACAPYVKVVLREDQVNATIDIVASPFVPEHLRDMLTRLTGFLENFDEQFADRFDGVLFGCNDSDDDSPDASAADDFDHDAYLDDEDADQAEAEAPEPLPPALLTLMQLDPNGSGTLDAASVAEICGRDRDTILDFMRITSEQQIEWVDSADAARADGEVADVAACEHEANAWAATLESLRAALRLVALPAPAGPPSHPQVPGQMELFDDEDADAAKDATGPGHAAPEATLFDDPV